MSSRPKPVVLIVLDGWGLRHQREHNAIAGARTPVWDRLWREAPHAAIRTSGSAVGLPAGQMGNSEVGHLNLGAGRVVYQEFTRISRAIRTGSFFSNRTLTDAVDMASAQRRRPHPRPALAGRRAQPRRAHPRPGSTSRSSAARQRVYLHAFLDGRDTPPKSAAPLARGAEATCSPSSARGRIACIIGRYYAMDRDNRWDRVEQAYDLLIEGMRRFAAPRRGERARSAPTSAARPTSS